VEEILSDIDAVAGVTGCFVCDRQGQVLSSTLGERYDHATLSMVGGIVAQTLTGIEVVTRRRKIGDFQLVFNQGCLSVRSLGEGCLFILCKRNINTTLLDITANVVQKKLSAAIQAR
jgi:hypothetical protein